MAAAKDPPLPVAVEEVAVEIRMSKKPPPA
jgi:hypothetical protein